MWCPLGKLIDLLGMRGCIDLGDRLESTVGKAVQSYRPRGHRSDLLKQVENETTKLGDRGLTAYADIRLLQGNNNGFQNKFHTKSTWDLINYILVLVIFYDQLLINLNI